MYNNYLPWLSKTQAEIGCMVPSSKYEFALDLQVASVKKLLLHNNNSQSCDEKNNHIDSNVVSKTDHDGINASL